MSTSLLNSVLSIANLFSVVNVFKIFSKTAQLSGVLDAYHLGEYKTFAQNLNFVLYKGDGQKIFEKPEQNANLDAYQLER